jgi:hypothetical protein
MRNLIIVIATGIITVLVNMGTGSLFNALMPGLEKSYENPCLFRSWSDPLMNLYWIVPFLNSALFVWIWKITYDTRARLNTIYPGVIYGLVFWIISIPGMIMTWSSFQIAGALVLSWTAGNLLSMLITGMIISRFGTASK